MKHIGQTLKNHIESNHLKKREIAEAAGISYNYLSTIFKQQSCDAELLEKLYVAAGLHPAMVFDVPDNVNKSFSDIVAQTILGNASVQISQNENLRELIAEKERLIDEKQRVIDEKERTIQILLSNQNIQISGLKRDNNDN